MAYDPTVRPWELLWESVHPHTAYWHDSGIAEAWRAEWKRFINLHEDELGPGYPLSGDEESPEEIYVWDGVEYPGVVFSYWGLREWKNGQLQGAGADGSGWPEL